MILAKFWRQTPVRFAIIFAVMFLLIAALAGVVAIVKINRELQDILDARVMHQYHLLQSVHKSEGLDALIRQVDLRSKNVSHKVGFVSLTTADNQPIAGVRGISVPKFGLSVFKPLRDIDYASDEKNDNQRQLGTDDHDYYRVMVGPVGTARLIVAIPLEELEETQEVLIGSFVFAALLILLLSILGGYFVTRRMQRRFDDLTVALHSVSSGELSTRLPLSNRKDDIDGFLRSINMTFDRLQRLMESMQQVSTDIAHDLKTPLGRLLIRAEQGLGDTQLSAPSRAAFVQIRDEAEQINQTFEALLRIAQIQSGVAKQRFDTVDLGHLVTDLIDTYQPVAQQSGLAMLAKVDTETPLVIIGDKILLTQLLANLIENSLTHSDCATRIVAEAARTVSGTTLTLADNGVGIPEVEREKVFRRLYRLEKSRNTPGTGLGLNLVRAIADLHDAQICLEDNFPGLRVIIKFP